MIIPSHRRAFGRAIVSVAAACLAWGAFVALHYHRLGLTLSHYDARGHLVVARRIFDSITPGWQQIGAVWLPLPHLLNALPVQSDAFYRNGASAVAISVVSFALAAGAVTWIVAMLTGSSAAAAAAAVVLALNPNVLYLQATPMTEPLLLGLTTAAVALLIDWCRQTIAEPSGPATSKSAVTGWMFALACLTRYEAWPVTACALTLGAVAIWRAGEHPGNALRRVAAIAVYPAAAGLAFLLFSRIVIGEWFVSSGFFVPENIALGHPRVAIDQIVWGVRMLSGYWLVALAIVGALAALTWGVVDRKRGDLLIALSLFSTAAVPWYAFLKGHPYRIRYMIPLIVAEAVAAGFAAGAAGRLALLKRWRSAPIVALLVIAAVELRPLDLAAPMVVEAQWDRPNVAVRQHVTDCLRAGYDGQTIMASMGSLGHYMQELSLAGFDIRDFLHEGNGDIWLAALHGPRPYAGWVLVEEKAEGGDMLAQIAREDPAFLDGFSRVCDGAGVALYRRTRETANHEDTKNTK